MDVFQRYVTAKYSPLSWGRIENLFPSWGIGNQNIALFRGNKRETSHELRAQRETTDTDICPRVETFCLNCWNIECWSNNWKSSHKSRYRTKMLTRNPVMNDPLCSDISRINVKIPDSQLINIQALLSCDWLTWTRHTPLVSSYVWNICAHTSYHSRYYKYFLSLATTQLQSGKLSKTSCWLRTE